MNNKRLQSGFTLIELLVSMVITVILLGILVYMTGISMDTYKKSRNEVRASRQAKEALDTISKDFESMISRRDGNTYEWLYAASEDVDDADKTQRGVGFTNKGQLIFFTGATDRYNGNIGGSGDLGGDVSAVGYRLAYKNQITDATDDNLKVFSLYRRLVDPKDAFDKLLAVPELDAVAGMFTEDNDLVASNFLVENIYEFTVTFLVEYSEIVGTAPITKIERVSLMSSSTGGYDEFRLKGNTLEITPAPTPSDKAAAIANGSIVGVEVSISVLTDHGLVLAQRSGMSQEEIFKKHSYHYTKTINTPRP